MQDVARRVLIAVSSRKRFSVRTAAIEFAHEIEGELQIVDGDRLPSWNFMPARSVRSQLRSSIRLPRLRCHGMTLRSAS